MSAILAQISIAIGFLMFLVVLGITTALDVPILSGIFRAIVVMCISSVVVVLFFKYFTALLHKFVVEQAMLHSRARHHGAERNGNQIVKEPENSPEEGIAE